MDKDCKTIIQEILTEATQNGNVIPEDELIQMLDKIPGFWKQAEREEGLGKIQKRKEKDKQK